MRVEVKNNGWVNGRFSSVRWIEVTPDLTVLAAGPVTVSVPMKLSGGTEIRVESHKGVVLRTDDVELRLEASITLTLASDARITVKAPGAEQAFSITAWNVRVEVEQPEEGPQEEVEEESQ
jgi:hypothetical protein